MSSTGQSANQYWSLFVPRKPAYREALRGGVFPPSGDGVQTKFGGKNKPSGGTALYYSEAKLLYRIGTREGERANTPSPRPPEARLIAQGKARRLTLRAEIWSTFVCRILPALLAPHLLRRRSGRKSLSTAPPAGHSSSKDKPTIQPHKNYDASTPYRLVP